MTETTINQTISIDKTLFKTVAAIPCYNEAEFIKDVVKKVSEYVDTVIVIDDGSTDDTAKVAQAVGAEVIRHETNKGYGQSIQSCFDAARQCHANVLITLDGDGQHDPQEIQRVLTPIINGEADIVIGSRFLDPAQKNRIRRYRKFGIDVITWLYNFGTNDKIIDAQSGFRAYTREVLESFLLTERGMSISVEVLIKARRKGFVIKEVPISCIYHAQGSSINPVIHGLSVAINVLKIRLKTKLFSNR
jgi:glycosyltransferase involved in cell wall biosynthesis